MPTGLPRGWTSALGAAIWNNNVDSRPAFNNVVHVLDSFALKVISTDLAVAHTVQIEAILGAFPFVLGQCILPAAAAANTPAVDTVSASGLGLATKPGQVLEITTPGANANVTIFILWQGYDL